MAADLLSGSVGQESTAAPAAGGHGDYLGRFVAGVLQTCSELEAPLIGLRDDGEPLPERLAVAFCAPASPELAPHGSAELDAPSGLPSAVAGAGPE
eukprot:1932358-Alexandrium_andersonii.AAC.1